MLQIYKFIVDKKTKGRSFILFFCLMLATTVSLAQNGAKITIKKNSISVIEALKEVEKQSGMSVGYNDSQRLRWKMHSLKFPKVQVSPIN